MWDTVGSVFFSLLGDAPVASSESVAATNEPAAIAADPPLDGVSGGGGGSSDGLSLSQGQNQGEMMALRCFIQTLMSILAPLVWNPLYAATVSSSNPARQNPGAVFFAIAACITLTLGGTVWMPGAALAPRMGSGWPVAAAAAEGRQGRSTAAEPLLPGA